ncbi:hypothetical protein FQN57_005164 [Myotisia sp. PD_48]|nr:hypothetical protein FQN57_005164 [Myotisia sp. PD_48]
MTRRKKSAAAVAAAAAAATGGGGTEASHPLPPKDPASPAPPASPASSASPAQGLSPSLPSTKVPKKKTSGEQPSTSALIISRNKHWRYISSFHGPWLQLPPEVLEGLAHSNYASPRPQPIDSAMFFDLVKIRRLIDEATDLAVRAANGSTMSSLNNSSTNSGGGGSSVLGLGVGGGSGKLSKERKHRMREHATQKLAMAYRLDEIAASVATMQSASALEDVARLVLERSPNDSDAKYVHFFHEKIPSRLLAQCTSLDPLNEVLALRQREGAVYRTRAVTKVLKNDYSGAVKDLTEGLATCRIYAPQQHETRNGKKPAPEPENEFTRRRPKNPAGVRTNVKVEDKDQPSGLESQLLFHRGGMYLTIACQHIEEALEALAAYQKSQPAPAPGADVDANTNADENETGKGKGKEKESASASLNVNANVDSTDQVGETSHQTPEQKLAHRRWLEARKLVKANARRALRDFTTFLSTLDYTPGLEPEAAEELVRRVSASAGFQKARAKAREHSKRIFDVTDHYLGTNENGNGKSDVKTTPEGLPQMKVYELSDLFTAQPPSDLPPYPNEFAPIASGGMQGRSKQYSSNLAGCHEVVTYHPLLTDTLHSLLLCHALLQTPEKELLRHAYMVARVTRVCDGYPIFLAPRSQARADWLEVLQRTENWIQLQYPWEILCAPAPLPGHQGYPQKDAASSQSLLESLAEERAMEDEGFWNAVRSWEKGKDTRSSGGGSSSSNSPFFKRWSQEDGKEYPSGAERSEAIAWWIKTAPVSAGTGKKKKGGSVDILKTTGPAPGPSGSAGQEPATGESSFKFPQKHTVA